MKQFCGMCHYYFDQQGNPTEPAQDGDLICHMSLCRRCHESNSNDEWGPMRAVLISPVSSAPVYRSAGYVAYIGKVEGE